MGAHLRRPRLQHPRSPATLPRPKWGRVPRARASLEGGKPNPPTRWPLTDSRASLVIHPSAWKVNSGKSALKVREGAVSMLSPRGLALAAVVAVLILSFGS